MSGLDLIASTLLAPAHGFTTRHGGVSQGEFASMNLGKSRGDKPGNVLKNYQILGKHLGFDVKKTVFTWQVHTDIIRTVTQEDWGQGLVMPQPTPCDGVITNVPGTTLVAFSADCTPILLWDEVTGAVGAVHAGWRGTSLGIVAKAVAEMTAQFGSNPADIRAVIGPCIASCCFETTDDVPTAMVEALGEVAHTAITSKGEKWLVDLKKLNHIWLQKAGVTQVEVRPECTACDLIRFWSHRKVGNVRGSLAAIIVCP
ncbi:MAG: peptidoglycan editing factor PgeF [Eubacteriales bacterium]